MNLEINSITPIHVGTGLNYTNLEFLIEGVEVKRFYLEKVLKNLNKQKLLNLIDSNFDKISLNSLIKENNLEFDEEIAKNYFFKRNGFNPTEEIRECIKSNKTPFIPGSSIKGAIKTILLWNYFKNNVNQLSSLKKDLLNKKNFSFNRRKNSLECKQYIFQNFFKSVFDFELNKKKQWRFDAKFDLMRFLMVSDFMPVGYSLELNKVETFSLKGNEFKSKNFSTYVEGVKGSFRGSIKLNSFLVSALKGKHKELLKQKLNELFGISSFNDLSEMEEQFFVFLKKTIKEYTQWVLEKELGLINAGASKELLKGVKKISELNNINETLLLRVGFGVGTIYQTIIKLIEEKQPELFREIRKKCDLGRINLIYPKSFELNIDKEPLGWLKLNL